MAGVSLNNVSKVYAPGQRPAVDGVSLDIADGSFVVLVGPSGCGKSTALRMIAGLEEVTGGTIEIGGRVVNDVEPKDRDIAMVFQNYALYPHMTVRKNLGFAIGLKGLSKADVKEKVESVAAMLGISELLERRPGELSGGQRQRVAVGRAIVRQPRVFLFDEPLSNLDAKLRLTTRAELKALHQRLKVTTVYVTHDQEEAMMLGDVVVVMNEGSVQQSAPPMEVYVEPANVFVAGFVGTPMMNLVRGQIRLQSDAAMFVRDGAEERDGVVLGRSKGLTDKQPVVLGVRPQALALVAEADSSTLARAIEVRVELVESLGESTDIRGQSAALGPITARLPGTAGVRSGESLRLVIDLTRVHLFAGTGRGERIDWRGA